MYEKSIGDTLGTLEEVLFFNNALKDRIVEPLTTFEFAQIKIESLKFVSEHFYFGNGIDIRNSFATADLVVDWAMRPVLKTK